MRWRTGRNLREVEEIENEERSGGMEGEKKGSEGEGVGARKSGERGR